MTGISSFQPAQSYPTVNASPARTADELRAERETISQPSNVPDAPPLETHRSSQAVKKQADPTSARLQAPLSPSANAAAQALAKPAPNLFERFAQAVSTAYHENRANSAAGDLAKHIKTGRFDASSVDLMANLTRHAAHLDPAGARQARSHPAIAILQGKLAGADGDTLVKVRNSPVFGELKAASTRTHAANEATLKRQKGLGLADSVELAGAAASQRAGAALKSNRHLDKMSAILGAACSGAHEGGAAGMRDRIDQQSTDKRLGQLKTESTLATEYPATLAPASSPLAHLGQAELSELSTFIKARFPAVPAPSQDNPVAIDARRELVQRQALKCEQQASQMLGKRLKGLSESARQQALRSIISADPKTLQRDLQPPQGNALRQAFNRVVGGNPAVAPELANYLQRGALRMLGGDNRVEAFRPDGMPSEVTFGGQRYQFDKRLGNGANGIAVRYSPVGHAGSGIVLKATLNQSERGQLGPGVADGEVVAKVGKEFANHQHAMGDDMQGHPNLLKVKGIIVAHPPDDLVRGPFDEYNNNENNADFYANKPFAPDHLADSVSLFTVMEEAGPGPEGLVKNINQQRETGAISEATHSLLMRNLFAQMVEGAAHLEDRGIAHRDLKMENMLVSQDGRVLIMDLGEGDVGQLTQPAPQTGTYITQSPELLNGSPGARKVDTWALGAIWRQMSNSVGLADPRLATVLDREDRAPAQWSLDNSGPIHSPKEITRSYQGQYSEITRSYKNQYSEKSQGNLDGVEQLTTAMLHPDQAQRPTLAALRNHHAIADPALQDPRLLELTQAIQRGNGAEIDRLNKSITASAGRAGPGAQG